MTKFLRTAAALLLLVTIACSRKPQTSRHPLLVLISIDTLRADHLPAYGYLKVKTPAIDSLARDAIVFDEAYSHVPLTLPSHACLLTGRLPYETGVRDNFGYRLGPDVPTLATLLGSAGYRSGAAVSTYVLRRDRGLDRGFAFYDDAVSPTKGRERAGLATAKALRGWAEGAGKGPLFLFLHIYEPHAPYEPPSPLDRIYANDPYDGEIAAADAAVGEFLGWLKASRRYDGAMIVLVADHGEGLGEHGEAEHGVLLYREDLHVPMIIKLPGNRAAGMRVSEPVGLDAVAPTVLEVASVAPPPGLAGRSVVHDGRPSADGKAVIYGETLYPRLHFGWSDLVSLTSSRYQYIDAPRRELYDLERDPAERLNLAGKLPDEVRAFARRLQSVQRAFRPPEKSTAEDAAALASLGYIHAVSVGPGGTDSLPDPKDKLGELAELKRLLKASDEGDTAAVLAGAPALLDRDPHLLVVWDIYGDVLRKRGRFAEAAAALRRAIDAAPSATLRSDLSKAYDNLAYVYEEIGDASAERRTIEEASSRGLASESMKQRLKILDGRPPAGAAPPAQLASAETRAAREMAAGRLDGAERILRSAWTGGNRRASVAADLGKIEIQRRRVVEAVSWFEKAVAREPRSAEYLELLGLAQAEAGDSGAATRSLGSAVALDAHRYDAIFNLGLLAARRGDVRKARSWFGRFIDAAPPETYSRQLRDAREIVRRIDAGSK